MIWLNLFFVGFFAFVGWKEGAPEALLLLCGFVFGVVWSAFAAAIDIHKR